MHWLRITVQHELTIERHHATLAVLEVALQAAIQALHDAHPEIDSEEETNPFEDNESTHLQMAFILVTSSRALLQSLHCYRTVSDLSIVF